MLKAFINKVLKRNSYSGKVVLIGTCTKSSEDDNLLYDEVDQALDSMYDWFGSPDSKSMKAALDGGYHALIKGSVVEQTQFAHFVRDIIHQQALPIVYSNSVDSLTAYLSQEHQENVGVININQKLDLISGYGGAPMQGMSMLVTEERDIEMLSLGVFEEWLTAIDKQLAGSMRVEWVGSSAFYSPRIELLSQRLQSFVERQDKIVVHVDLRSIVRGLTVQPPFALELESVVEVLQQLMRSGKVELVQMTGDSESTIYSKEAKKVLDIVRCKNHHFDMSLLQL